MSNMIPRDFIDNLLVRVDIVDLIDSYLPLKKVGRNHNARCPFHIEKTPSFSVSRERQFYHCFGCGAGGNAISFLMAFSHLDFVEAIEDLARFVGVDVPRVTNSGSKKKHNYTPLYEILEQVAVFYTEQLSKHPHAIKYLKNRKLNDEITKDFSLGYAPDKWDALASRFDNKLLLDAGMLANKNDKVYDRFRARLVFPIRDKRKRIIAFGGRVLDDSEPKYLNSPETAIFSKGQELYGLSELLQKDSKPKRILLVEGYMDVLALAQFGINYSVASLGTATSKKHFDLLFRFTSELVFCFDGDSAGKKAIWRGVQEALPCLRDGCYIKLMLLPEKQDPDSLIRSEGLAAFEQRIDNAKALSDFYFEQICDGLNLDTLEGKSQLLTKTQTDIKKIPNGFFREMMIAKLKQLSSSTALDILENSAKLDSKKKFKKTDSGFLISGEKVVLALLLQTPEMAEIVEELNPDWEKLCFASKAGLRDVLRNIELNQPENTGRLLEIYRQDEEKFAWLSKLALLQVFPQESKGFDIKAEFKDALMRVIKQGSREFKHNDLLKSKKGDTSTQK